MIQNISNPRSASSEYNRLSPDGSKGGVRGGLDMAVLFIHVTI